MYRFEKTHTHSTVNAVTHSCKLTNYIQIPASCFYPHQLCATIPFSEIQVVVIASLSPRIQSSCWFQWESLNELRKRWRLWRLGSRWCILTPVHRGGQTAHRTIPQVPPSSFKQENKKPVFSQHPLRGLPSQTYKHAKPSHSLAQTGPHLLTNPGLNTHTLYARWPMLFRRPQPQANNVPLSLRLPPPVSGILSLLPLLCTVP